MEAARITTPPRSPGQRMDALRQANRVRVHRKEIKVDLKAGRKTLEEVMDDPLCESMKALDALRALPKVGRVKAAKVLRLARVSPSKTIGGLTDRQRSEMLERLSKPIGV